MNLELYRIIGETLNAGIEKSYRAGLASIVKLNKKEILRLKDEPELFKINYTGTDNAMLMNFRVEAFTVAGVMSYELQEKLKQLALDLQEGKHPLTKGEKSIKDVWVAEAQSIMADYISIQDMPPPRYLNTNLRTAMQSSYHAAQFNRLQDPSVKELYPSYQYKTLNDARVREQHRKLHDKIWKNNDEIWNHIWPPNGWNCRCYVKPLNQEEENNSAVEPLTSSNELRQEIVREGKIGKDFDRNPGQVRSIWGKWLQSRLSGKNYSNISDDIVRAGYRMPKWEEIEQLLKVNAAPEPEPVEFSEENFVKLFGELPGSVNSVLGKYRLADVFFRKLAEREKGNRRKIIQYIKPTMEEPHIVFVDRENGTLFVKAFKSNNETIYAGILKQLNDEEIVISFYHKNNIHNKVNEGKFLVYQSLFPASDNAWGLPKFTHDGGRVNFESKLAVSAGIRNIKITADVMDENEVKNIMNDANEIWGEVYNYNGVVNSEINFIRYRIDGFQLVKVNNNEAYEHKFIGYDKIDEYRKGVILK